MRAALLLFPSLGVLACGSRSELYAIGGGLRDGGDDVSLGADASEDAPEDAPIDVGPDVMCKGKAISVTLNAPNLYFVIDHSFSMNEMNKWSNIRTAVSNLMTQLGAGARFGAALFPGGDTSGNCQVGIEVMS
ncbi:MAG: vWA domain-containing protein, partial [Polyangiaceae bacterium]